MSCLKKIELLPMEGAISQVVKAMLFTIAAERAAGTRLLKIHYGEEKTLKLRVFRELKRLKGEGRLVCYFSSEKFTSSHGESLYLVDKFPTIADDELFDKGDGGYAILFLG